MNEQNPFESMFMGPPDETGRLESFVTRPRSQHTELLAAASPELRIMGMRATTREAQPKGLGTERRPFSSDQLAHNVAVYPRDRMVIDHAGAFIPRSRFGHNEEIMRELRQAGVFSPPRIEQARLRPTTTRPIDCTRELRWLAEHRDEYAGQWVALDGDRLLSHGANAREVYQAARRSGVEAPVVVQVESADKSPFGGW